ncbi:MAG: hypothetical protein Q4D80_02630 [Pseudomonadota bacterium]|nr:hypothetical protein [Pseudomonadota bacterium]
MKLKLAARVNKSVSYILPAPIKGLNMRDSLADMDAGYAIVMDNYMPQDTKVALRKGYIKYAELDEKICTLAEYKAGDTNSFFAVAAGKLYNVSSRKNIYAYDAVSFSNSYCRTQQYKNYLYFVNGSDTPKVYYQDESGAEHFEDWGFSAENLNATRIAGVSLSKQRLWFIESGSLKVWYPATAGNISGPLNCFDLSQIARFGGELRAVANWTQDGGQGIDDLTVFITSEGEALVYAGSDINNAATWKLSGSYKISRPIGYNCLVPYQGDVVIISEDGYVPLSKALPLEQANASQIAFSDSIRGLILSRTARNLNRYGWQGIIYSRGGYALFNVPVSNQYEQHVINVNTGAWCRFTGIRSHCWGIYNQKLYFGADKGIFLFDEGYSDDGVEISGCVEQAYNNLGSNSIKKIQLLNPRTKSSSGYSLVIYTNMDMENRKVNYKENLADSSLHKWNETKWSSSAAPAGIRWGAAESTTIRSQWIANSSTGYKASVVFKTKTKGNLIEWYETGIRYETGSGVL